MAIKQFSPGIFTHEVISNLTKTERRQVKERSLGLLNIEDRLSELDAIARNTLQAAGMRFIPGGVESKISEKDWRKNYKLGDAMEILNYIGMLRDAIKDEKIEEAVRHALNLGQVSVRFYVRPQERSAKAGRSNLKNLEKGQKAPNHYEAAQRRNKQWVVYYNSLNPKLSATNRYNMAAKYFNDPTRHSDEERVVTASAVKKAVQKSLKK